MRKLLCWLGWHKYGDAVTVGDDFSHTMLWLFSSVEVVKHCRHCGYEKRVQG